MQFFAKLLNIFFVLCRTAVNPAANVRVAV